MAMTTGTGSVTGSTASFDYELPSLGADMDAGRVVEWTVQVGEFVHRGDVVARVETEKSDIDVEIWHPGTVDEMLVDLGVEIAVGTPILRLTAAEHDAAPRDNPAGTPDEMADDEHPKREGSTSDSPVLASPLARHLAARYGIDLRDVAGTGPRGAVVSADVDRIAALVIDVAHADADRAPVAASPDATGNDDAGSASKPQGGVVVDPMRRLIAQRMSEANRDIPHYYLQHDIDLTALTEWLKRENSQREVARRLVPAAALVRAVALAAARHPELNGYWRDGHFEPVGDVNVAMAISLRGGGLVTPNVANADHCSLDETMARLKELVSAARSGSLRGSWMTGATITITNLGDRGVNLVHGVISPPQVALVGFGRPTERPSAIDGEVVVRTILTATLAADHRATDGVTGGRFLVTLADLLEHPEEL